MNGLPDDKNQLEEEEIQRIRDAAVRRALNTPPKPKTPKNKKEGEQRPSQKAEDDGGRR